MRTKDAGERLLDILGSGEIGEAYQLAGQVVYELEEAKERVAKLVVAIRRMVEAGGRAEFQREFDAAKNILRDAEQAAPEPATVAVDAGALEDLREAVGHLDKQPVYLLSISRARAEVLAMEAARRLLAGGE